MNLRSRIDGALALAVFVFSALACGGGTSPQSTIADLKASARFSGTQFVVTSLGTEPWRSVKLDVNGGTFSSGYVYSFDSLAAGETATIGVLQFANSEGKRFNPIELKPQKMVVTAVLPNGQTGMYVGEWK